MTDEPDQRSGLRSRGLAWFVAQLILMAGVGVAGLVNLLSAGNWSPAGPIASVIGAILICLGLAVAGLAYLGLHAVASFSPLPRPLETGSLADSGIYALVRHPMYDGVLLGSFGWAITSGSVVALVLAVVLSGLFDAKARREEAWLADRYADYAPYRARTRRFVPKVY